MVNLKGRRKSKTSGSSKISHLQIAKEGEDGERCSDEQKNGSTDVRSGRENNGKRRLRSAGVFPSKKWFTLGVKIHSGSA